MFDRIRSGARRAGKVIGYGTTIAGIATTLANAHNPMPTTKQLSEFTKIRAAETRLDRRRILDEGTRLKGQATTSLVLKDLSKMDKKRR